MLPNSYDDDAFEKLRAEQRWQRDMIRAANYPHTRVGQEPATLGDGASSGDAALDEVAVRWAARELLEPHREFIEVEACNVMRLRVHHVTRSMKGGPHIDGSRSRIANSSRYSMVDQEYDGEKAAERNKDLRDAVALIDLAEALRSSTP